MSASPSDRRIYEQIVVLPKFWFWVALCALMPLQFWFVSHDPWFSQPPKPVGDGPDYENIAFHLWRGPGWSLDWTNPEWRAPYVAASVPGGLTAADPEPDSADLVGARSNEPELADASTHQPIADYGVQLQRADSLSATTARPPLFPLLIAQIYYVCGRGPLGFAGVRLVSAASIALAGALAVSLTVRLISCMTPLSWPVIFAAMLSMALAALDRTVRSYATDFLTEPLALLLVQLLLWSLSTSLLPSRSESPGKIEPRPNGHSLAHRWPSREIRSLTLAGVMLGLLILTRSMIVLWLPGMWLMFLVVRALRNRQQLKADLSAAVSINIVDDICRATWVVTVALLLCAPWWIRNCIVLQAFMPLGTQGPISLVGGYHDQARQRGGEWYVGPELQLRQTIGQQLPDETILEREVRVARAASGQINQWINDHWGQLPILAWVRVKTEWNPYHGRTFVLRLAALVGLCWLLILHRSAAILLGGIILINTATVMVLYSVGGRFLVPTYGMIYCLAALGVASTIARRNLKAVD